MEAEEMRPQRRLRVLQSVRLSDLEPSLGGCQGGVRMGKGRGKGREISGNGLFSSIDSYNFISVGPPCRKKGAKYAANATHHPAEGDQVLRAALWDLHVVFSDET